MDAFDLELVEDLFAPRRAAQRRRGHVELRLLLAGPFRCLFEVVLDGAREREQLSGEPDDQVPTLMQQVGGAVLNKVDRLVPCRCAKR